LAAADASGHLTFGLLIVFVALHGLGSGLFQPAFGGIIPLLVDEPALGAANAIVGISRPPAFVRGPVVAGVIYGAAGSRAMWAVAAAAFVASAAFLAFARPRVYDRGPAESLGTELTSGFRYVARVPWLWITIGTFSVVLLVGYAALQVLLPKLVREARDGGVGPHAVPFT